MAPGRNELQHGEQMPQFNPKTDMHKLRETDLIFMKRIESMNLERVKDLKAVRKRNKILGFGLTFLALGIYGYTFYAIQQERFLDDFNVPETIIEEPKAKAK